MAKSAVKPIFSPLPHPSFFAPKSPFFPPFPVSNPIPGDFSRNRARFLPCEAHFFSSFLVLGSTSGDFSRNLSHFSLRSPLFALHEGFFISCFPYSSLPPPPSSPDLLPFRPTITPPSSPPLSFSFLPTFPSPSSINARTCAPSRTTRVRAHAPLPARQEVFVFILHRFTPPSQFTVHQCVRGEGKREKAFTKMHNILTINTLKQNTRFHPP